MTVVGFHDHAIVKIDMNIFTTKELIVLIGSADFIGIAILYSFKLKITHDTCNLCQ